MEGPVSTQMTQYCTMGQLAYVHHVVLSQGRIMFRWLVVISKIYISMSQIMVTLMVMITWYDLRPGEDRPRAVRTWSHMATTLTPREDVWERDECRVMVPMKGQEIEQDGM
jgi:hypothetical protein